MEYKKKPDKRSKAGKYFFNRVGGKNKTESEQDAGYLSHNHSSRIEETKTYKAMELKYKDKLNSEIALEEVAKEHAKNIRQDKDRGAKNKAIDMDYKLQGTIYPKDEAEIESGDVKIIVRAKE